MSGPESGEEERWTRIFLADPDTSKITSEHVTGALSGFALEPQKDMVWLARAIQPAVWIAAKSKRKTAELKGHAATRDELKKLADRASSLWREIAELDGELREAIERLAWDRWTLGDDAARWEDLKAELDAYGEAVKQLYGLSVYLTKASAHVGGKKQAGKWMSANLMLWRVDFATYLTPSFEKGFGATAAWNNRDYANGQRPEHWADFYQRIMALAFGEKETPNLEFVLKEGRARVPENGALFEPGIFPE